MAIRAFDLRTGLTAVAFLAAAACGGLPTSPEASCRRYPTSLTDSRGAFFECALEHAAGGDIQLACGAGLDTRSWRYATVAAFVDEASVAGRFQFTAMQSSVFGLSGGGGSLDTFRYDATGRRLERVRSVAPNAAGVPAGEVDTTTFTGWDAQGRPTQGVLRTAQGSTFPVSIAYDDAARTTIWTNGERWRQDANGNIVEYEIAFGNGGPTIPTQFTIQTTARICRGDAIP